MAIFLFKKLAGKFYSPTDVLALTTDLFVDELSRRGWNSQLKCTFQDKKITLTFGPQVKANNLNPQDLSALWNAPEFKQIHQQLQEVVKGLLDQVQSIAVPIQSILTRRGGGGGSSGDIKTDSKPPVGEIWASIGWSLLGRTIRIDLTVDASAIQASRALPSWANLASIPTSFNIPGLGQVKVSDFMVDGETIVDAISKIRTHLEAKGWSGKFTVVGGSIAVLEGGNGVAVSATLPFRGAESAPPSGGGGHGWGNWSLPKLDIHAAVQEGVKYYLNDLVKDAADLVENTAVAYYGHSTERPTSGTLEGTNQLEVRGHGIYFHFEADVPSICSTRSFEEKKKQNQHGWTSDVAEYVDHQGGWTHLYNQGVAGVTDLWNQYQGGGGRGGGAPAVRSRGFEEQGVVYGQPTHSSDATIAAAPLRRSYSSDYTTREPSYVYHQSASPAQPVRYVETRGTTSHAYVPSHQSHQPVQYEYHRRY